MLGVSCDHDFSVPCIRPSRTYLNVRPHGDLLSKGQGAIQKNYRYHLSRHVGSASESSRTNTRFLPSPSHFSNPCTQPALSGASILGFTPQSYEGSTARLPRRQ